ncbi:hypothetical protein HZB01_02100 [Candidatus Woesearchaeota archaeon]|nr:hypothetical protein [Candidatus Woesearchaeota archaeon]
MRRKTISYNTIKNNTRLYDFSDMQAAVLATTLRDIPPTLKSFQKESDSLLLGFF